MCSNTRAGFTTVLFFFIIAMQIVFVVVGPCFSLIFILVCMAYCCYKLYQLIQLRIREDGEVRQRAREIEQRLAELEQLIRERKEQVAREKEQVTREKEQVTRDLLYHSSLERVSSKRDVVRSRSLPTVRCLHGD